MMLRLPASTIELERRDLDWHHQRSTSRIHRHALFRVYARRPEVQEWAHLSPIIRGKNDIPPPLFADDAPFPAAPTPDPDPLPLDHIRVRRNPHRRQYMSQDVRRATSSIAESEVTTPTRSSTSTESGAYSDEDELQRVLHRYSPRTEESRTSHNSQDLRPRLDGVVETRREIYQGTPAQSDPLSSSPNFPPRPCNRNLSRVLPLRLRQTSATAPIYASPLRFGQAALSSSPERRPRSRVLAPTSSEQGATAVAMIRPAQPPRIISIRSEISELNLDEDDAAAQTHRQLESFSPASETDLQRFRATLSPSPLLGQTTSPSNNNYDQVVSLLADRRRHSPSYERSTSESHPVSPISPAVEGARVAVQARSPSLPVSPRTPARTQHRSEVHRSQVHRSPRTPGRQLRVYDDSRSPTFQPQTPVGLPRNGIPRTSLGGSFTAPPMRRHRHRNLFDQWEYMGTHESGQPIYRRVLEGEGEQENVLDSGGRALIELGTLDVESERNSNALEFTPPRRRRQRNHGLPA